MSKVSIRTMSRRQLLLAGAGVAGAAVVAGGAPPGAREAPAPAANDTKTTPERGGGYRLSEHVQRYYRTARV